MLARAGIAWNEFDVTSPRATGTMLRLVDGEHSDGSVDIHFSDDGSLSAPIGAGPGQASNFLE
jgi:hypothetical protein